MRVYLDNCCYNRPYDDQTQLRISLESQAKLRIQDMIRDGKLELVSSFVLQYENARNPFEIKRKAISRFLDANTSVYIDRTFLEPVKTIAASIQQTGVKTADAYHVACSIIGQCDYMLTTDDQLLRYYTDRIQIVNPVEFIRQMGGIDRD